MEINNKKTNAATVNLILKFIGNDQSNFFDEVYGACDQIEQIRSIEQFSELKWEAVPPHIDQILDIYDMNLIKKLFEKTQFAAANFLQSEAASDFRKKIEKDELREKLEML